MRDWCRCCGKLRETKQHEGIPLCAACVRKIREGKVPSLSEIKRIQGEKI